MCTRRILLVMRKRQVKRIVRQIIYFSLTIAALSYITAIIVERRLRHADYGDTRARANGGTDFNGDAVTPEVTVMERPETRHPPRPPHQERIAVQQSVQQKLAPPKRNAGFFHVPPSNGQKKSWEDPALKEREAQRSGLGERGMPAYILEESQKALELNMSLENGFNGLLCDLISFNRSLPDARDERCHEMQYLAKLPMVSVILPFWNEHLSALQRSLHSIVNRSPAELLHEIIIVDDGSDRASLKAPLDAYVAATFGDLVRVVRLPERSGLIVARLAGARVATADVLIFFDSHIECNHNWLPPLLEPIAIDPRISTCPIVDVIDHATFEYRSAASQGSRGAFSWNMLYKQLPALPGQNFSATDPTPNPVMMGGLFAIGRKFFWDVGGYDEGLDIWGAEQFELSFKIWMCGGMLFDVPCSRVGHIFRGPMAPRPSPRKHNFFAKNIKRVAEVWMDEYKQYVYNRDPAFAESDAGDITAQRAIREKLQCKSFKWFLEEVAPDLLEKYPPIPPPNYASGTLQSLAYPQYCLDKMNRPKEQEVGLFYCAENKTHPQSNQHWVLSYARDVRDSSDTVCLDVQSNRPNALVLMWNCHEQGGNQFWYYDRKLQWLVHGRNGHSCLEAVFEDGEYMVYANMCDNSNLRMKWAFGWVNETALDQFYDDLLD